MKIIIVGLGKVGYAIAQQMVGEEHDLILVDESAAVIEHADATLDAMCVEGNGACASVLLRAGVRDADLVIAATADDEVNLVCSLMAKKLGAKHTVARVRNPEYFRDAPILRREIGLDMIINPEYAAAQIERASCACPPRSAWRASPAAPWSSSASRSPSRTAWPARA